jgi:aspartyl-tRNA(Asn)/glutamyl-tRNA(Gln) amidotransferase subunit C
MNSDTAQNLADLARLSIPLGERESVAKDLGSIIGFVDEIQKVDVSDIEGHTSSVNIFRDDIIAPIVPAYDLVEAAAMHQDHFVKVPKVIGQ